MGACPAASARICERERPPANPVVGRIGESEERHPLRARRIGRADRGKQVGRRHTTHRDEPSRLDPAARQPGGAPGPEDVRAGRERLIQTPEQ